MANLTAEMIEAVGPAGRLDWLISEVQVVLEEAEVSMLRVPRHCRALLIAARASLVPGTCFRRVFWAKCDLTDASNMLESFGYDDLAALAGRAAMMASELAEQLRTSEGSNE